MAREGYITPVGFAREPRRERLRWIGRFFLLLLVIALLWMLLYRVISPEDTSEVRTDPPEELVGPL